MSFDSREFPTPFDHFNTVITSCPTRLNVLHFDVELCTPKRHYVFDTTGRATDLEPVRFGESIRAPQRRATFPKRQPESHE